MRGFLDFERPIIELEEQLEKIQLLYGQDELADATRRDDIQALKKAIDEKSRQIYGNLSPWDRCRLARHPERPIFPDFLKAIFTDFIPLAGDRAYGDDSALIGGFGRLGKQPVVILGQQKGRTTRENVARNFAMSRPEGYRKAVRLMKLGEKYRRPILSFIDTPGAFPGRDAEERGQSEAIARSIFVMSTLTVPIIVTIIGEGGSGGALAIGVGDRVLMMENAFYSVISPEGCASILWRDPGHADKAAKALRISSKELLELGIVDEVIPEGLGGAHRAPPLSFENLSSSLTKILDQLMDIPQEELVSRRYEKYRAMGKYSEVYPKGA